MTSQTSSWLVWAGSNAGDGSLTSRDKYFEDIIKAYHRLFSIFYNKPAFEPAQTSQELVYDVKNLLLLAGIYCALPAVTPAVEARLMTWNVCHHNFSENLSSLIEIAIKIQSKPLFNDAFIYTVGKWKPGDLRGTLGASMDELVDSEVIRIQHIKLSLQHKLSLYILSGALKHTKHAEVAKVYAKHEKSPDERTLYNGINYRLRSQGIPGFNELLDELVRINLEYRESNGVKYRTCLACARKLEDSEYPWAGNPFQ